jgi:hypothetical protein
MINACPPRDARSLIISDAFLYNQMVDMMTTNCRRMSRRKYSRDWSMFRRLRTKVAANWAR